MSTDDPFRPQPGEPPADAIRPAPATPDHTFSPTRLDERPPSLPLDYIGESVVGPLPPPAPPRPPHPSFGWAVLWCFLFLIMTQIVPGFGVGIAAVIYVAVRWGLDAVDTVDRVQEIALMPSIAIAQLSGIAFSLVALRLVAGRDWARQVGLRLPRAWQLVVLVLGFPSLPILASGAYALAKDHIPGIPEVVPFYLTQLVVIPLAWLVVYLAAGTGWNLRLARQPVLVQAALVAAGVAGTVLVGIALYWLISPPLLKVFRIPFEGQLMEETVKQFRSWPWAVAVLIVGFGPGLSEELLCRAYLGRGLVGHYGVVLGVVLSSYLFGLIHIEPHQATMAVLMGLVLHAAYLLTRSLLAPMLLHALNNALSVVGDKLGGELAKVDAEPETIPLSLYLASALLMVVAGWVLYRGRSRMAPVEEGQLPWQPAFPGPAYPPVGSDTVVVRPWPGGLATGLLIGAAILFGAVVYLIETKQLAW